MSKNGSGFEALTQKIHALSVQAKEDKPLAKALAECEKELKALEECYVCLKETVDTIDDGIYVTDGEGKTLYVNPAYCNMLGIQPEDVLGRTTEEIMTEGKLFKVSSSVRVIQTHKEAIIATHMVDKKGSETYIIGRPVFDEKGKLKRVVVSHYFMNSLYHRFEDFKKRHLEEGVAVRDHSQDKDPMFQKVQGRNPQIMEVKKIIQKIAKTDVTVLITGESGTGKEVFADYLFRLSDRSDKPYIKVNCTAIPANLLESELFGYEKGAFTGASAKGKMGLFEKANGGTILLDEIGDLPMELQSKLLRVLQQKEIFRVGSVTPIKLDVRVIALTNASLKQKIADGSFRSDLYYRLSGLPLDIPPLRDRREDISELAEYYLDKYNKKYERNLSLSASLLMRFENYDWPGNVRELENVMEYLILCSDEKYLSEAVFERILGIAPNDEPKGKTTLNAMMDNYEKRLIETTVKQSDNIEEAAHRLGLTADELGQRMEEHGISAG